MNIENERNIAVVKVEITFKNTEREVEIDEDKVKKKKN